MLSVPIHLLLPHSPSLCNIHHSIKGGPRALELPPSELYPYGWRGAPVSRSRGNCLLAAFLLCPTLKTADGLAVGQFLSRDSWILFRRPSDVRGPVLRTRW